MGIRGLNRVDPRSTMNLSRTSIKSFVNFSVDIPINARQLTNHRPIKLSINKQVSEIVGDEGSGTSMKFQDLQTLILIQI